MMLKGPYFRAAFVVSIIFSSWTAFGKANEPEVLLRRPFDDKGQELVLTRGPALNPALLRHWRPDDLKSPRGGSYLPVTGLSELTLTLVTPGEPDLRLGSRLVMEEARQTNKGVVILDLAFNRSLIVVAAAFGSELCLWRIGPLREGFEQSLTAIGGWSAAAAPFRIASEMVSVKLSFADNDTIEATVVEKRQTEKITRYVEVVGQRFQMKRVDD